MNQSPDEKKMLRFQFQFFTLQGTITFPIPAGTFKSMIFLFPRVEYVIVSWMFFQLIEVVKGPRDPGSPKLRMVSWNLNTSHFGGDKKNTIWNKCFVGLTKLLQYFSGCLNSTVPFSLTPGSAPVFVLPFFSEVKSWFSSAVAWMISNEVAGVTMWDPAIV